MDGADESLLIRRRAKEFGETARQAVEEGGSSYNNLTALIDYLKRLRNSDAFFGLSTLAPGLEDVKSEESLSKSVVTIGLP
ncbi:hypothetical protein VNO80_22708 [Phaseolus coccineus]|uniref:Uncharacterized protein n=1 Tax=Phaseolus coccineus TaxID=3886 RepID=A0AAN9MB38_PHACN